MPDVIQASAPMKAAFESVVRARRAPRAKSPALLATNGE